MGLPMAPNQNTEVFGTIQDEAGNNQLVLRFVEVEFPIGEPGKAYDFYSLDWEIKHDAEWIQNIVISRADFQKGCRRRRWVNQVQSFDPDSGRAILLIGEEGLPDADGSMDVIYSWREWDVRKNKEVRLIRVCEDPFESFEKGESSR